MKRPPVYSSTDVLNMFGYASTNSLTHSIRLGRFPKPDTHIKDSKGVNRNYWFKETLDAEKRRRDAVIAGGTRAGNHMTNTPTHRLRRV